ELLEDLGQRAVEVGAGVPAERFLEVTERRRPILARDRDTPEAAQGVRIVGVRRQHRLEVLLCVRAAVETKERVAARQTRVDVARRDRDRRALLAHRALEIAPR